ncbi:MAG TPA: carboxypeptidase M32 [Spirochaetales bacterium]|nr:carboxypeptidase M32 [Spirochaetales bacterium]
MQNPLQELRALDHEIVLLKHVSALLGWDQETYLPGKGIEERAEQISAVETLIHEKIISPKTQDILEAAFNAEEMEQTSDPFIQAAFLREWKRTHERAVKIPSRLVSRFAHATSIGQARWAKAREESSYSLFKPFLKEILVLSREIASALGYKDSPYDPLLDGYEPGMRGKEIAAVFDQLQKELLPLLKELLKLPKPKTDFLYLPMSKEDQERFGKRILEAMGFPWDRGRLDISAHPFTTTLGSDDVRITTRYNPNYFPTSLFGIIHEGGHALYELGFSSFIRGTILADGISMGIHESQSRFWENCIGRSVPFWKYWYPILQKEYISALESVPLKDFLQAVNRVEASPIRIEADEVTYPLHILLRFRLEKALIENSLDLEDLPDAWNDGMEELLGIKPRNDSEGVLQDIHWSMGNFGYFPTYALGTLYAAQFYAALLREKPGVVQEIERGDYRSLLSWLQEGIHTHGRVYLADELCRRITGSSLDPGWFIQYVRDKYQVLFN